MPLMARLKALVLLAFILWPPLYMALTLAYFVFFFATTEGQKPEPVIPPYFLVFIAAQLFTVFESICVMAYCVYHLAIIVKPPKDKLIIWAIALAMGNILVTPIYWYVHIWSPLGRPKPAVDSLRVAS